MTRIEPGVARPEFADLLCLRGYHLGAEIGVQGGDHAALLLAGWPGRLLLVDPWRHSDDPAYRDDANVDDEVHEMHLLRCQEQMERFGGRAVIMRMFSVEAARLIADGVLDYVYIDAKHTYAAVTEDLEAWWPKVRAGGIISGHDYTVDAPPREGNVFGVKPAVDDFVQGRAETLYVSDEEWPTWFFFKG